MTETATLTEVVVSFYRNSFDRIGIASNLDEVMEDIRTGKWKAEVEKVRNEKDEKKRSVLKQQIPACAISGHFSERKESGLISHSNRLAVDFDLQDNAALQEGLEAVKEALCRDKHSEYVALSVSGKGLFVICRIDGSRHAESFAFLERYYSETYGLTIDKSCKDVSRLRFVSYDPELFHNPNAVIVPESKPEHKPEHGTHQDTGYDNKAVMDAIVKSGRLIGNDSYADWVKVGLALGSTFGESGRQYFHDLSSRSGKYDASDCDKKFDNCLRSNQGKVGFGTIVHMAKEAGIKLPKSKTKKKDIESKDITFGDFWTIEDGKVSLNLVVLFREYLPSKGFGRFCPNPKDAGYVYVRISNNKVEQIQDFQIKDFLVNDLLCRCNAASEDEKEVLKQILRQVQASSSFIFSRWQLNLLPYIRPDFLKDTQDTAYIYFTNGFLEITATKTILHPYEKLKELNKCVWGKNITKHDFTSVESPGMFAELVGNTSSYVLSDDEVKSESTRGETHLKKGDRHIRVSDFESKCSALGYLLHGYKTPATCPVIVAVDARNDDGNSSEGGTGKSMVMIQAPSRMLNLLQMDGQTTDPGERFAFQGVTPETRIVGIDDVGRKFNFMSLFQRITGDFTTEAKNMPKLSIPFEDSPKIAITTNFTLKGDGHSFDRRQFIIEFSDFYRHRKPKDVHGKTFFTAWDKAEWDSFYSFMIACIQQYLKCGLVAPKIRSYEHRKLLASVPEGFFDWCDSVIALDREYERDVLFDNFKTFSGDRDITTKNFTGYIKKWVTHKGYVFNPSRNGKRVIRNGRVYFKFGEKE